MRRQSTIGLSLLLVGLGVAAIVRTVQGGIGGGLGFAFGGLLILAGGLRIYLTRHS